MADTGFFADKVNRIKTLIQESHIDKIVEQIYNKDIIIFLGNTKSGKSTLINHLLGNELEAFRVGRNPIRIKLSNATNFSGPSIGLTSVSETSIPAVWSLRDNTGILVDTPGFNDNRGEEQDVFNSFCINEMILNAQSVKFIAIVDIQNILNDNISSFINFIDNLYDMFSLSTKNQQEIQQLFQGIGMVFNKDVDDVSISEVVDIFRTKIINNNTIHVRNKILIRFLIQNRRNMTICRTPVQEGPISGNVFGSIKSMIQSRVNRINKTFLTKTKFGLSSKSQKFLSEAHTFFSETTEIDIYLQKIQDNYNNFLMSIPNNNEKIIKLQNQKAKLEELNGEVKQISKDQQSILEKILRLNYIAGFPIVSSEEIEKIRNIILFSLFTDMILDIEQSDIFFIKITSMLVTMINKVNAMVIAIQQRSNMLSIQEANRLIQNLENEKKRSEQALRNRITQIKSSTQQKLESGYDQMSNQNQPQTSLPQSLRPTNTNIHLNSNIPSKGQPSVAYDHSVENKRPSGVINNPDMVVKQTTRPTHTVTYSSSENETFENKEKVLESIKNSLSTIESNQVITDIRDQDIILFLGNTKSGKSTVVNYVLGNQLKAVRTGNTNKYQIQRVDEEENGPSIGQYSVSHTSIPTAWYSSNVFSFMVDAPGFDDNRGIAQDVLNAFYIKELIVRSRSVKFVLISDINDIKSDNINQFISLMTKIDKTLPFLDEELVKGISIIFTKDKDNSSLTEIKQIMREGILQNYSIYIRDKRLVRHFVNCEKCMEILRMPDVGGLLPDDEKMRTDITDVINRTKSIPATRISRSTPGISDKSLSFLLEAREQLMMPSRFDSSLNRIKANFSVYLDQHTKSWTSDSRNFQETQNFLTKTATEIKEIANKDDFANMLTSIKALDSSLIPVDLMNDLGKQFDFVMFVDDILQVKQSSVFIVQLKSLLTSMFFLVNEHIIRVRLENNLIHKNEADKKIQDLRDEKIRFEKQLLEKIDSMKKINAQLDQEIRNLPKQKSFFQRITDTIKDIGTTIRENIDEIKTSVSVITTVLPLIL